MKATAALCNGRAMGTLAVLVIVVILATTSASLADEVINWSSGEPNYPIQCQSGCAILYPASGAILEPGTDVSCIVTIATDVDVRFSNVSGTSYRGDSIRYQWTAKDSLGAHVGSWPNGSMGRGVIWKAPSTSVGAVTIECAVSDLAQITESGGLTVYGSKDDADVVLSVVVSVNNPPLDGEFRYDPITGRRRFMTDSRGTTSYEYDVLGRLTKKTEPDGKWIAYQYDLNNNRTKMTTHSEGTPSFHHVTQYAYNNRNLLWKVYDQLAERDENGEPTANAVYTEYTYYPNGLVDEIRYPNETKAVHTYNERNWLISIVNKKSNGTVIAGFAYEYTYDPGNGKWGKNGTRTAVVEEILTPQGTTPEVIKARVDYKYDDLYRLTREVRTGNDGNPGVAYDKQYFYDPAGNRTRMIADSVQTDYTYDSANKMLSAGNATFTYDDAGNTLNCNDGNSYAWDHLNRMSQFYTGDVTFTYDYDGGGYRVGRRQDGEVPTALLLDVSDIAEEITGDQVVSYVGLDDVSKIVGSNRSQYHSDGIGSSRIITDGAQTVGSVAIYDAFGNVLMQTDDCSYGYVGKYRYHADSESGLTYLKARYYSASLGRFVSPDPLGYVDGPNRYGYASNNPVMNIDPDGLLTACELLFRMPTWRSTRKLGSQSSYGSWTAGFTVEGGPLDRSLITTVRCWIERDITITDAMRTTVSWWSLSLCYNHCGSMWTQEHRWNVERDWTRTRHKNEKHNWSFQTGPFVPDPNHGSMIYGIKCMEAMPPHLRDALR